MSAHLRESLLLGLPNELIVPILSYLPSSDLKNVSLTCTSLYALAVVPLWRHVCLTDRRRNSHHVLQSGRGCGTPPLCTEAHPDSWFHDEHDDTPTIMKLFILARNPIIASKVLFVTHRCHLPLPREDTDLPFMQFNSQSISRSPELRCLISLAVRNLIKVHTLRIINGHRNIAVALLEEFFSPQRLHCMRPRKLWLETSSIWGVRETIWPMMKSLESLRVRRMPANEQSYPGYPWTRLVRDGDWVTFRESEVDEYGTYTEHCETDWMDLCTPQTSSMVDKCEVAMWNNLLEVKEFLRGHPDFEYEVWQNALIYDLPDTPKPPLAQLLAFASSLTSITLDWILWPQSDDENYEATISILIQLSRLKFPNLCAFQLRNAVRLRGDIPPPLNTKLPRDIYLLETSFLSFLEYHQNIRCLAFPLDRFYSNRAERGINEGRVRRVVTNLSTVLTELRLDTNLIEAGNDFINLNGISESELERTRRRRFIQEFAPYMTKIEHLKLECDIPRDEVREIMRALHKCSLKKIVIINFKFPLGNTWGERGEDLKRVDPGVAATESSGRLDDLQQETNLTFPKWKDATDAIPLPVPQDFRPVYGWDASPPLLDIIAAHHSSTVEELKLCGFTGAPILSEWSPAADRILYSLRHFHNLKELTISTWLLTWFEDDYRDEEIIKYWMDSRNPSSTALAVVAPSTPTQQAPVSDNTASDEESDEHNAWEEKLKNDYAPCSLAVRIADRLLPYLSFRARSKAGGVKVHVNFVLGREAVDMFDMHLEIGVKDARQPIPGIIKSFEGPCFEADRERFWRKLDARRWF